MKKAIVRFFAGIAVIGTVMSCGASKTSQNINYMQDIREDTVMKMTRSEGILVQPKDMISIVVTSRTPELSAMFNLPLVTSSISGNSASTGGGQRVLGYSVDNDGCIDFPTLGKVPVAGLNRWGVAQLIKNELRERNLLKDAVVTVEFMNFKFSVIGEVAHPGTFAVSGDKINLLEALSQAGDLTIYGRRDNIQVTREQNGKRYVYLVDLRSTDLYDSPAYYLRQNDIIYVEPNKVRAGQSTINENRFRSVNFWVSLSTSVLTIVNIILTIASK